MENEMPEKPDEIEQGIEKRGHDLEVLAEEMDLVIDDKSNISELSEDLDYLTVEGFDKMAGGILEALAAVDDTYEQKDNESQEIIEQSFQAQADFCNNLEKATHNVAHLDHVLGRIKSAFGAKDGLAEARNSAVEEGQFFDGCLQLERTLIDDNLQKRHDQRYQLEQIGAQQRFASERQIEKAIRDAKGTPASKISTDMNRRCSEFHRSLKQQLGDMKRILSTRKDHFATSQQKDSAARPFDIHNSYGTLYKKPLPDYGHGKS